MDGRLQGGAYAVAWAAWGRASREESSYLHDVYRCIDLGGVTNGSDLAAAQWQLLQRATAANQ